MAAPSYLLNAEVFRDELCAFLFFYYQRWIAVEARGGFIGEVWFPPLEMAGKKGLATHSSQGAV